METILAWSQLMITLATLIGLVVAVYKFSRDPDEDAKNRLNLIEKTCVIRKEVYEKLFNTITRDIALIKENHLRHIELDIGKIKGDVKVIKTLLRQLNK